MPDAGGIAMIRACRDSDIDAVVTVWREAGDFAHPFLSTEFQNSEARNVRNVYPQFAEIWVKEVDGTVIGFIALVGNEVGAIFVLPALHGIGIGRELMDFAVAHKGAVMVEVFRDNIVGRRFYDGYGFQIVAESLHGPSGQVVLKMAYDPAFA